VPYIEVLFGLAVAIAGVAIATVAAGLGYVSGGVPGAGFFPFWVGLLLVVSGLALAVMTWRHPSKTERVESGQLVSIAAGGAFLAVMAAAGAIVATVAYLLATVWMTRRHGILVTVATAVITAALTYFTFQVWLLVPLPRGWLFH
jgi:putative tricarboxylic transport membrane protein